MRPVQSAIICSQVAEAAPPVGQIQLAALRITLQRIDNGEGQAFKHRALQFGAGGVRANAEKAGPRVRAVKRRTFAIEVRLPEDAAAAGSTAAIACSGRPRSASSEICCCSQSMFGVPACIGNRDHLSGFGMGDKARRLVHRLRAAADDPGAAGGAEDRVDIPFVDRAAAQRGATDIQQRPGGHRRRGGQPGQRRHRVAQRAGQGIRDQQGETAAAVRSAPSRSSPPRTSCRSAD